MYASAFAPPVNRFMLVSDLHLSVACNGVIYNLTEQHYTDTLVPISPEVELHVETEPTLKVQYTIKDVGTVTKQVLSIRGEPTTVCTFTCNWQCSNVELIVRPLLSGRPHHSLLQTALQWVDHSSDSHTHWNSDFLHIYAQSSMQYHANTAIYEHIFYSEEQARGYDCTETLYSPGYFTSTDSGTIHLALSSKPLTQHS